MKITFVNTHDIIGGAERCSYDLVRNFNTCGHDVSLIVGGKSGSDSFVKKINYLYFDGKFRHFVFSILGLTDTTLAAPIYNCYLWPELKKADIYNIHNMHGAYWNFWSLPILARRAPVVLTLHDEWFMTGDCAYTYDCERWLQHCGHCPQASIPIYGNRYAIGGRDATRLNLALKRLCSKTIPASRMIIITPSQWLLQRASRAPHLGKFEFRHIENGIDLKIYQPLNKNDCKKELGLPLDKKLIFTAAARVHDRRKNFAMITSLLRKGKWPKEAMLICAGRVKDEEKNKYEGLPVKFLGYIAEREQMAKALSACDFSLILSNADNLPYTGLEALACGCPVIGSNIGGIPEIVDEGTTGWLLPTGCNEDELGNVVHSVCRLPASKMMEMSRKAREKAERCYGMERFTEKYRQLFEEMIKRCG